VTHLKRTHLSTLSIASMLLLSACGGGGGSSSGGSGVPNSGADTTPPNVSFSPATLTVVSGGTGTSMLNRSDARGSTRLISANCTNGGEFNDVVDRFTAPNVTVDTTSVCTAIVQDTSNNEARANLTVTITAPPPDTTAPVIKAEFRPRPPLVVRMAAHIT